MITQRMMVGNSKKEMLAWTFTVDTEATATGEKFTGIPFYLTGTSQTAAVLNVDWGDGTKSTLTASDYTTSDGTASVHEYAAAGEYQIIVTSPDWSNIRLFKIHNATTDITSSNVSNRTRGLYYFRRTLISVDSALPPVFGIHLNSPTSTSFVADTSTFRYLFAFCAKLRSVTADLLVNTLSTTSTPDRLFANCTSLTTVPAALFKPLVGTTSFLDVFRSSGLTTIPSGLFDFNTAVTSFQYAFYNCSNLTEIPLGLFDKNTEVTDFTYCFRGCTSLSAIPAALFLYNTKVTIMSSCFNDCTGLTAIPEGLFNTNTLVTSFASTFSGCSGILTIPESLFQYNTAVTTVDSCLSGCSSLDSFSLIIGSPSISQASSFVTKKTGAVRTIHVKPNTTTQTTFNNKASTLGLTIVADVA